MRTRSVFSLLAIVVFGVVGWVGPAFAIFDTSISGTLSISTPEIPTVTLSTPPATVNVTSGASAIGNSTASDLSGLFVSTHVQGLIGVPPSSAMADIIATIDWTIALTPGGPPLVITLAGLTTHSQTALAPVPGESVSVLSELTLSFEFLFGGPGGPDAANGGLPILYHEEWTLVAGGSPIGSVINLLGQPLVPIPGATGVTLHWSAHSHGVDSANAVAPAPVPATLALLGSGLTALGTLAWRRRR